MPALRSIDMLLVDDVFDMHGGYVLDFSDRTFATFFAELNLDIDEPIYAREGTSKAKRLRCFLRAVDKATAIRVLKSLWEYRGIILGRGWQPSRPIENAEGIFLRLMTVLGDVQAPARGFAPKPAFDRAKFLEFNTELVNLASLAPQPRGYAFEKFLKRIFDAFGLQAHGAFRLVGEQIDGSFDLGNETYLLEAKWQNELTGVAELHGFHGKIEQKAAFTRGLFVSYSGFSDDGLVALGRGKRIICLDGLDLSDALSRELPLNTVLERKVRHAGETGGVFCRVRDLFR